MVAGMRGPLLLDVNILLGYLSIHLAAPSRCVLAGLCQGSVHSITRPHLAGNYPAAGTRLAPLSLCCLHLLFCTDSPDLSEWVCVGGSFRVSLLSLKQKKFKDHIQLPGTNVNLE